MPEVQRRAVLFGGPLDGHVTAPRSLPFVWVGAAADGVRVYDRPGPARVLYRTDGDRLVFAANTHWLCEACEYPRPRTGKGMCPACGAKLIPA